MHGVPLESGKAAGTNEHVSGDKREIIDFVSAFTIETTPASAAKVADFRHHLRPGTAVYITLLPGTDYLESVATAQRLRSEGFQPIPHIPARSIRSREVLEDYLKRVTDGAGCDRVLVIAGAVQEPLGPFFDSMQVLETGLLDRYGIKTIGVAGHPEGSPDFPEEAASAALAWKNAFAERTDANLHIVTQFCFDAAPIIAWDKRLRAAGNTLPIHIGVPGIATIKTLLNYAVACGIGNSMNFIKRQAANVTKLLKLQAPDVLLRDLAHYAAHDPACGIKGVHMYPLGGLKKTATWTYGVIDGRFELGRKGGFSVDVDLG